jgi:N-acetylated-alpha-linked acidic dipeptidase
VPSLKQYMRDVAKSVPSPKGGSVYDQWKAAAEKKEHERSKPPEPDSSGTPAAEPPAAAPSDVRVGNLGSGSDYTAFLQHLGVPAADIGSHGPYGVYHSAFDNFAWFTKFGDPTFVYEQEMARVYGLEAIRLASADILPFNYQDYGKEIGEYLKAAEPKAKKVLKVQNGTIGDPGGMNLILRNTERAFLIPSGLPDRPWFKHAIYAPGEYTGYAAVVIPGVNEAIDSKDLTTMQQQLQLLTEAINRAAELLERAK